MVCCCVLRTMQMVMAVVRCEIITIHVNTPQMFVYMRHIK